MWTYLSYQGCFSIGLYVFANIASGIILFCKPNQLKRKTKFLDFFQCDKVKIFDIQRQKNIF